MTEVMLKQFEGEHTQTTQRMIKLLKDCLFYDLDKILSFFPSLKKNNIVNFYLFGSRLFGTANEKSDFDFIVVVNEWDGPFVLQCEDPSIDLTVYSIKVFKEKVLKNSYHEMLMIWLPKEYKLLETLSPLEIIGSKIQSSNFRSTISLQAKQVWERSKETFEKKDYVRAKKGIVHALRIFILACQMSKGCISDWTGAVKYTELMNKYENETDWKKINEIFRPIYNELHLEFTKSAPLKDEKKDLKN